MTLSELQSELEIIVAAEAEQAPLEPVAYRPRTEAERDAKLRHIELEFAAADARQRIGQNVDATAILQALRDAERVPELERERDEARRALLAALDRLRDTGHEVAAEDCPYVVERPDQEILAALRDGWHQGRNRALSVMQGAIAGIRSAAEAGFVPEPTAPSEPAQQFRCFDGVEPGAEAPGDTEPCQECGATGRVPAGPSDTQLLDALDRLCPMRGEDGSWDVCSDDMTVLAEGMETAREAARFCLDHSPEGSQ